MQLSRRVGAFVLHRAAPRGCSPVARSSTLLRVQASSYLYYTMYFNPPLQSVTCTLAEPECTLDATPGRAGCTRSTLRLAEPGERERSCH
jgi:hypothetical protein